MRLVLVVVVLWLFGLPSALAQSEHWLVLPITAGEDVAWMQPGPEHKSTLAVESEPSECALRVNGVLVAAMALALPYQRKTPWWAWRSGGLGVGFGAVSIAAAVTSDAEPPQSCDVNGPDPSTCVSRGRQRDGAILFGVTAAPLVTMPLVYVLRRGDKKLGDQLTPAIHFGRLGGTIAVRGVL